MAEERSVGIIGLGLVGRALAHRLVEANYSVYGYDISAEALAAARQIGVVGAEDAQEVARSSRIILFSLLTSENRRELCWGPQALAAALRPGTIILDTSTGRPEDIEEDSRRLSRDGVRLVDVCLSGSSQVIREGRALALVGDSAENADYAELLRILSRAQYYFDAPGQGNRVKLIVNLVFGLHRLVLAEALGLARAGGFRLEAILDILKAGETYSVVMDTKGPKMISGVYEPAVARLEQHAKDVRLILEYARGLHAKTPVSETHARLIEELVRDGYGHLDNAAIFEAYRAP